MINNAILGVIAGARPRPAVPIDPHYSSVIALLHFNGANGSTTMLDEKGGTWTAFNTATLATGQSKFGGSSLVLQGGSAYIAHASDIKFSYGTGDFTIEMWLYPTNTSPTARIVYDQRDTTYPAPPAARPVVYIFGSQVRYYVNGADCIAGGGISEHSWHHIAVSRVAGSTRLYLDGAQIGSTWADTTNYSAAPVYLGVNADALGGGFTLPYVGYVDDLRVTKGVGRYTGASFTVPSAQFPDI